MTSRRPPGKAFDAAEHARVSRVERHEETPLFTDPSLNFEAEGGFLEIAEKHADETERRVRAAHSNVITFRVPKNELQRIAEQYARAVAIAKAYWLAEANRRAAVQREPAA